MPFWGHILAKKGPFGPKWAEFPYSSKGKLLAQIQPLKAPIWPQKGCFGVVSMESGYLGLIGGIGQFWSTGSFASGHLVRRPVFKGHDISKTGSISGICL